jgi:hypothetical protein
VSRFFRPNSDIGTLGKRTRGRARRPSPLTYGPVSRPGYLFFSRDPTASTIASSSGNWSVANLE